MVFEAGEHSIELYNLMTILLVSSSAISRSFFSFYYWLFQNEIKATDNKFKLWWHCNALAFDDKLYSYDVKGIVELHFAIFP